MKNNIDHELIELLEKIIVFLNNSEESVYSPLTIDEIVNDLKLEIKKLKQGKKINKQKLIFEFLPTSTLNEISIENGWSDEYIELSGKFDLLIKKY